MSRAWNSWPIKSTQNETRLPCHGGGGGGCAEGGGWSSFGVELWTSPLDQLHISRWCASFLPLLPPESTVGLRFKAVAVEKLAATLFINIKPFLVLHSINKMLSVS